MPVGLEEGAIFHAGPAIKRTAGGIRVISIGPTTSARMNPVMPELIDRLSLRCVIGKGGMDDGVSAQMAKTGCMYASALGGCAPLYTRAVKSVRRIVWDEMGPEALYELHVEAMGPLVVTMDAHGESLHRQVRLEAEARLKALLETSRSRRGQI